MNTGSVLGAFFGIGLVSLAIFMSINEIDVLQIQAAWGIFINIPAVMIVLGGSLAATVISFNTDALNIVIRSMTTVLTRPGPNFVRQKREIVGLATLATQGSLKLDEVAKKIRNPFLKDGIKMLSDNYSLEEIEDVLGQRIEFRLRKERNDSEIIRTIARYTPAFGMTGTLIGLIAMLSRLSLEGDALTHIGADMAVAMVTTFYGLILAYLIFLPLAVKMEKRTEDEVFMMGMISDSIRMIKEEWHPRKVEDYLNSYLPPSQRKRAKHIGDYERLLKR